MLSRRLAAICFKYKITRLFFSLLHGCGIACLRPGTPSCAGVVFFQLLIKWWTVLKVVFAIGLSVLIFTKGVPVPVLGTASFAILLVIFSGKNLRQDPHRTVER